jgi:DNA polymerase III subunit delta'
VRWKVLERELNDLVGQDHLRDWISDVIESEKIGHAYVFSGTEGMGKKTFATIFAKLCLCNNIKKSKREESSRSSGGDFLESCGFCHSCKTFESGTNPDFYFLIRENKSIGVDDIRKLQENIHIAPMYSERKVYLIPEAELMTDPSQNALLKTLEEPPPNVMIILLTTNMDKFLETISSRVVRKDLKKYTKLEIQGFLNREFSTQENLDFIAGIADGNMGKAIRLMEDQNFMEFREVVFSIILDFNNEKRDSQYNVFKIFRR